MRIAISLFLIVAPIIVYVMVIRPRLKARYVDTYANIDNWWARQWARVVAFRTWIIATIGLALPELIDAGMWAANAIQGLSGADLSILPGWLQQFIRVAALIAIMINQARKTTPVGQPEPGAEPEKV